MVARRKWPSDPTAVCLAIDIHQYTALSLAKYITADRIKESGGFYKLDVIEFCRQSGFPTSIGLCTWYSNSETEYAQSAMSEI